MMYKYMVECLLLLLLTLATHVHLLCVLHLQDSQTLIQCLRTMTVSPQIPDLSIDLDSLE